MIDCAEMKDMITVEKEVYEAVLRNSIRVIDLEAENQQLKELLKECRVYVENCEQFNQYDLDMRAFFICQFR